MGILKGVPPQKKSTGVPPTKGVNQNVGMDPHHESYVYCGVPADVNVILIFSCGVPTGDAI